MRPFCVSLLCLPLALFSLSAFCAETPGSSSPAAQLPLKDNSAVAPCWVESSLKRIYPTSAPGSSSTLTLLAARNSQVSFQVALKNPTSKPLDVLCETTAPKGLSVQVRRVGYVPMVHHSTDIPTELLEGVGHVPGLVPDPLFPETRGSVGPLENLAFWITVRVAKDSEPGRRDLQIALHDAASSEAARLSAAIDVRPFTIETTNSFPVTHWWHPDAIWDAHHVEPYSEAWWKLARAYVKDMVDHRSATIMVPLLHGRNDRTPHLQQLLKVTTTSQERYAFDFAATRRFIRMARECGAQSFEWSHLFLGWGANKAAPVVVDTPDGPVDLFAPDAPAASGKYREFLAQLLPELYKFLQQEKLLDQSYFHLSDEPSGEEHYKNYKQVRQMIRDLAPWMKVMDALSEVGYGKERIVDYPVPILNAAREYRKAGIPHWVYFCCGPRGRYLNRFLDTPLATIRMSGWLFYRLEAQGFLHWGYDYWRDFGDASKMRDPFLQADGGSWPGIPSGDCFVVYPGKDGPIDSIRWEVFSESLQDYAILQSAAIKPDDPLLKELKDYDDFPRSEQWINSTLKAVVK